MLYPGVRASDVANDVGWPLRVHDTIVVADPPSLEDLVLLRERLDPNHLFLKT
jgi:hypothetical protein